MKKFTIISAIDEHFGIGKNNALPWRLPEDMKHFKETTWGGTVIMGRKTWESIPEKFRPFEGRKNIVISRSEQQLPKGVVLVHSLEEALEKSEGKAFVIGGASLYQEAIQNEACEELILTRVPESHDCDAFFPKIPAHFVKVGVEPLNSKGIQVEKWKRQTL